MCDSSPAPAPSVPTSQTITQSNIPDWAQPYAQQMLGQTQALTNSPYQQYTGQRIADFSPLQQQAFNNVANMQTNAGTGAAMGYSQDVAQRAATQGPYNAQNFGNQYGQGPQFQNMGLGYLSATAPGTQAAQLAAAPQMQSAQFQGPGNVYSQRVGTGAFNQPGAAESYMSPYQQNVTDFQKQQAVQDYSRQLPGMGAAAANAGAFGGSRQAVANSEGQRNLTNQLAGIQATGSQNAFQNAQQAFQTDQARQLQAQQSNQQSGLQAQLANQGMDYNTSLQNAQFGQQAGLANQALLGQYGLQQGQFQQSANAQDAQQALQAQLANQGAYGQMQGLGMQQNLAGNQQAMQNAAQGAQYGLAGQQAGEQSRQFGANYGLQNLQQQLAAAGQLGSLGQQQYAQNMGINAAQQQAGAQVQAQEQQGLSQNYQDFLNQQNMPYKQLGFMSDILRGTPASAGASTMYQAPPSNMSQFGGVAQLGLGALMKYGPGSTPG